MKRLTGRLGPYGKPLMGRDGPYDEEAYRLGPYRKPLTGGTLRCLRGGWGPLLLTRGPLAGTPLTETPSLQGASCGRDDEKAYGKAGPLQGPLRADRLRGGWGPLREGSLRGGLYGNTPYEKRRPYGSLLREVLTSPFTEKDDEKVYRKAGTLREGPLRGGFLREGSPYGCWLA